MRKIKWPNNKKFAFTIIDDTDGSTLQNTKPVYDFLISKGILTTKTVWVFPSRDDTWTGSSLQNEEYLKYVKFLYKSGFEIAFHNAGSGGFKRDETLFALNFLKKEFGSYPILHINHGDNIENLYWGPNRFSGLIKLLYAQKKKNVRSEGENPKSPYFWGDIAKKNIKYIRNRTFKQLNTLKCDRRLVYKEKGKTDFSNYWFSSSDGMRLSSFLELINKKSIDKLVKKHGCAIVYTHFSYDFVDENGVLNSDFKSVIDYLTTKDGWFVPASTLLDFVLNDKEYKPSLFYQIKQDLKWFFEKTFKKRNY